MARKLPRLKPIAIKERRSFLYLQYGRLEVQDGAFVLVDAQGARIHIPVGSVTCLLLEPGTTVTHAAIELASRAGTLLVWIGEGGVRLYSAGQPGGARSDRLLYQASLALDPSARLKVVRKMFEFRFGHPPERRSVEQLRGIEGVRVRTMYQQLANQHGIKWKSRNYDRASWDKADVANRCLSVATSCLYGVSEAAILAAGYAPAIGFLHSGKPRSFVYDIADLFKFETVVPLAFEIAAKPGRGLESEVRGRCRDIFRKSRLLKRIIPTIEEVLASGGLPNPRPYDDSQPPAFLDDPHLGDAGHRG